MSLLSIVLTFNEEAHIDRCIRSLKKVSTDILVVDSFSTDKTTDIAESLGARVLQNNWINHSSQFNWALSKIRKKYDWILRIDADEVISEHLEYEINTKLSKVPAQTDGIFVNRHIMFQGKLVKYGGISSVYVLRIFRQGKGSCEKRWMDEHIHVLGKTTKFSGEIIDNNLMSLSQWIEKHNNYASLEAIDHLNKKYNFMDHNSIGSIKTTTKTVFKRWVKDNIYNLLPLKLRVVIYFLYRFFFKFGFLDSPEGRSFHVLQGFWYRYIVDIKILEIERYVKKNGVDIKIAIKKICNVEV